MPGLTDTGSSSALGWLTLQQLWHIPDHKLKPLSVITKTRPTGHMSPACLSITQAGNSLPQLKQLSSCSRRHSKHCHTTEASFLELRYAEALPRATEYFVKVRSWPHLLPGRFTPFKERYLQSFCSKHREKPVGSDSYTFCSEVFFACCLKWTPPGNNATVCPNWIRSKVCLLNTILCNTEPLASETISSNVNWAQAKF